MYAIKMDNAKTLIVTKYTSIYEGENKADSLVFLLPQMNGLTDLSKTTVFLRYISPDGIGHAEEFAGAPEKYNDTYYQYNFPVNSGITAQPGIVTLWLTALDADRNILMKTSLLAIEIQPSREIEVFLPEENQGQLDSMEAKIAKLFQGKADGLVYNSDSRQVQLTAENNPIGNAVVVPDDAYSEAIIGTATTSWSDMEGSKQEKSVSEETWNDI